MRIGYNLFLWHILGRIKNGCFRRKILSLVFFPSLGQISLLLCLIAPTLLSSNLSAVYKGKESWGWLWWVWDPLALVESSSSCWQFLRMRIPQNSSGKTQSFPPWLCAGGTAWHSSLCFITQSRSVLFQLQDGREALSSAHHVKSKFT